MRNDVEIYMNFFANTMNFIDCKQNGMMHIAIILKKKVSSILLANSKNFVQNMINKSRVSEKQKEETIKLAKIIKMQQI